MSTELKLGPARDFERDWILDLWSDQFGLHGDGEHERTLVDDALDRDTGRIRCYTIGSREELYAFTVVTTFSIEGVSDAYAEFDTADWPTAVTNGNTYIICVADHAKNHGYATALVRRSYEWFWHNDVRRVWATCWHRDGHVDSRRLFRSLGYEQVGEAEGYYAAAADEAPRHCPDCGTGCTCPASMWTKVLEEDDVDFA